MAHSASTHQAAATRLLIADAEADLGRMLALYMPGFGYEVSLATSPAQLDVSLRMQRPDLVVMDPALLASSVVQAGQALRTRTDAPFILLCGAPRCAPNNWLPSTPSAWVSGCSIRVNAGCFLSRA